MKHTIELDTVELIVLRHALDEYIWIVKNNRDLMREELRTTRQIRRTIESELQIDDGETSKED